MSAEQDKVDANINLLLAIHFEGMDPIARANLTESIEQIKEDYELAAQNAENSKYYKDLKESIAKSLPSLVKATYGAVEAFKKNDYISGSAAIIDMCSSVIPVFASLTSAGGPATAMIGAVFSVAGQILSFFLPKQPSLEKQIEKMFAHLRSEEKIVEIEAFGKSVNSYTDSLRTKCIGAHSTEEHPLAGTVALTPNSEIVTGTGTTFTQTAVAGQWLVFDSDKYRPYTIKAITSNTSLTLVLPYVGAQTASSSAKLLLRKTTHRGIAEILAMPLQSEDDANEFLDEMTALAFGLVRNQQQLDTPRFANWQVAAFLEREANYPTEGWPEVLGVWCRTYTDLLSANMMLNCLADPKTLDARIAETNEKGYKGPLPETKRQMCNASLLALKGLARELRRSWDSDKKEMVKTVRKIRPVAQQRGVYAHVGYRQNGRVLYVALGPGSESDLNWDYKSNTGWLKRISINVPLEQKGSFKPQYELLTCENDNVIRRHRLNSVNGDLVNSDTSIPRRRERNEEFLDVCGVPISKEHIGANNAEPMTLVAVAGAVTSEKTPYFYPNMYTMGKPGVSTRIDYEPHWGRSDDIRSVTHPPRPLSDDPDADALEDPAATPNGLVLLNQQTNIYYGGARNGNHINVLAWANVGTVPGPAGWSGYSGIEVDPYFLWVFGTGGISCATHASIIKCRQGKIQQPRWLEHHFDKSLWSSGSPPPVYSLCPSADGTFAACLTNSDIYTANYSIDRASNRIVTTSWKKRGGGGAQVVKMPIPCWDALESLTANLQSS